MPDIEEEEPEGEEEEEDEAADEEISQAQAEMMIGDAETFLRHAWDLLEDLVAAKKAPKALADRLEKLHDDVADLLPE